MSRFSWCAVWMLMLAGPVFAQREAMTELYGEGVHRYFSGDFAGADQALTTVVDSGSSDPRAHYFRGLVREVLGQGGDADFQTGARLEVEGRRVVDVGAALTRVQGGTRGKIEQARRDARIAAAQQRLLHEQARRDAGAVAPASAESDVAPVDPSAAAASDPFANEGLRSEEATVDPDPPEAPDATTDPFADDPAVPAPAADPAAPAVEDPFGAPADPGPGGAADPFGTAPSADAPASDPFGAPSGDPFGTPAPAAEPAPAEPAPADPFGTPGGAVPDPFAPEPAGAPTEGEVNPFGT